MDELTCSKKCKMSDWSAIPTVLPERQTDKWKALKYRVKAANVPTWAQRTQESIWESWGEVGDWAGKRVMECEMSTEHDKGRAGKGSGSKGSRDAEHGQACTKDRTGSVALRAPLELAVQLGRGDEVNRQAEVANRTKCRDSPHLAWYPLTRTRKWIV
jgi:hypothetical protein